MTTITTLQSASAYQPKTQDYPNVGSANDDPNYPYNHLKPAYPDLKWEPYSETPFEHHNKGHLADKNKKDLFSVTSKIDNIEPAIGTEVTFQEGKNLFTLNEAQLNDLALLAAERGILIFRNQPVDPKKALEFGRYFSPVLHKHPVSPQARAAAEDPDLENLHIIYADKYKKPNTGAFTPTENFHSDITYELQPPTATFLQVITAPPTGGDTVFSSAYAAYDSFSPSLQAYLETLYAVHSGVNQAKGAEAAGHPIRIPPVEHIHPLVRVHPVTGWKALYVQPGFSRALLAKQGDNFVSLPKHENDHVLNLLYRQVADQVDAQVRVRWGSGDVVIFENSVTAHSAIFNSFPNQRHAFRVTPQGERPRSIEEHNKLFPENPARSRIQDIEKAEGITSEISSINLNQAKGYSD
ncbi:TauD-domain-containing protein [Wallemia mellicola]|nr:TauD-domain-containing protein [Wallemia mellicola]